MSKCPHCQQPIDADQSAAGAVCPHCGGLVTLDDEGLAGKQTFDLIPQQSSDVLDDIELSLEDDEEATLPFDRNVERTVEFEPPESEPPAGSAGNDLTTDIGDTTIDHVDLSDLNEELDAAQDDSGQDKTVEDPSPSDESPDAKGHASDADSPADATVDESVLDDLEIATDDPSATIDYVSDATVEFDDLSQGPTEEVSERIDSTVDFDSDKTIDLASSHPELAKKMSSQWAGTIDLATPQHQTIRQPEGDEQAKQRSTLPVKSRTLSQSSSEQTKSRIQPSDAPDYELLSQIGQGGMGVVYAARQSSIARKVAVKMLKSSEKAGADQRDKFISEAVVTGELDHPNIVPIYDLGSNEQGALFYSMKHVQGTPWDEVLADKSLDENLNILLRVADAVAFAHARGVVHRDLKPENVMLGEFGEVLVMDWGLARVTQQFPSVSSIHQTGSLGGTPAYMSPEMARGPVENIDHTSDIYLLGAILYEIIGDRAPHSGKDVMQCLMAAAQNVIDPVEYSGELLDVALKAMSTEQAERYQSVKDFQTAVRVYLSHSESLILTAHAEHHLADARLNKDYQLYARALYGFGESLALWKENTKARALLTETELDYASQALSNDDLDLAESLLDSGKPEHTELLKQVHAAQRERRSKQSLLKWTKRAVAALLVAILAMGTFFYIKIAASNVEIAEQRDEAKRQEGIANDNAKLATDNEAKAVENAEQARLNAKEAEEQARIAEQRRVEAEEQRKKAEEEEKRANENRVVAEQNAEAARLAEKAANEAREREEYEAYVAGIGLAAAKIDENAYDFALELLSNAPVDRRHWEWGRLRYLCQLSAAVYEQGAPIDAVAYSPDGKLLAAGDRSGKLTVRNATTGEVQFTTDNGQYVYAVAFSPDGRLIATGSSNGKIRIFNSSDGELRRTLEGHGDGVLDVAFSPNGRQLASGSYDSTARLWDLASGQSIATLAGHNWWVWSAQFSPDGSQIVTASQDSNAIVWRRDAAGEFKQTAQLSDHQGPVYAATFSPDGSRVATAGYDKTIRLWDPKQVDRLDVGSRLDSSAERNGALAVLAGHTGAVRSVAFAPSGILLLSGSHDNSLRLWDLEQATEAKALRGHGSRVEAVAISPTGKLAVSGSQDGSVRVWDVAGYAESRTIGSRTLAGHADAVLAARFAADGRVLTASRDRTAKLWDPSGVELVRFEQGHEFLATSAVFYDDGQRLVTGAGDNTARVWNVGSGAELMVMRGAGRAGAVAVDPAGQLLATGGAKGAVQLWDLATGERIAELTGHEAEVTAAAFNSSSNLLATGDDRGEIRLWTIEGGQATLQSTLNSHNRTITGIIFGAAGDKLYSSSGDNTSARWDVATGSEIRDAVLKHPNWVSAMDLASDESHSVTACEDGKVRVWNLASGDVVAQASFDKGSATGVQFSPDASTILVTSADNRGVWNWAWQNAQQAPLDDTQPLVAAKELGSLWTASYTPDGRRVLTVGGNDARMFDATTGKPGLRFSPHGAVAAIAITQDGRVVATGSWDGTAKLWDAATGKVLRQLVGGHTGYINSIDFSPDGQWVATASDDGTARLWRVSDGEPTPTVLEGHTGALRSVRFSPDGGRLLTTSSDRTAKLWDAASGEALQTLTGHRWGVLCGEFSADGARVATGSQDNTARVWNPSTGEVVTTMSGHTSAVTSVAFSPDAARLLTGSQDIAAKLWDTSTGGEILTLTGHTQDLTAVDFSRDGRTALSASRDGVAILWPTVDWREPAAAMMVGP